MKTKYFKVGDSWKKIVIGGEEESKLTKDFIEEYFELLKTVLKKAEDNGFRGTDALKVSLAVFEKSASPMHYKFDELLEKKKDEFMDEQKVRKNY
ncbi:MAG: hypothetical protein GOU97_04530 [Nanoarchaeota archaeon]|nr:hypothetical protein [Nanoarchaeota archaeon]